MHFLFQVSNILFFILPPLLIRLHCSYAAHCGKGETQKKRSQIIRSRRYTLDPEVLAESTQTSKVPPTESDPEPIYVKICLESVRKCDEKRRRKKHNTALKTKWIFLGFCNILQEQTMVTVITIARPQAFTLCGSFLWLWEPALLTFMQL